MFLMSRGVFEFACLALFLELVRFFLFFGLNYFFGWFSLFLLWAFGILYAISLPIVGLLKCIYIYIYIHRCRD